MDPHPYLDMILDTLSKNLVFWVRFQFSTQMCGYLEYDFEKLPSIRYTLPDLPLKCFLNIHSNAPELEHPYFVSLSAGSALGTVILGGAYVFEAYHARRSEHAPAFKWV